MFKVEIEHDHYRISTDRDSYTTQIREEIIKACEHYYLGHLPSDKKCPIRRERIDENETR